MARAFRFGCVSRKPAASRAEWHQRVRRIDAWGFDVLLVPDHLWLWPPFTSLVAAVEATDRLRVGTHVLNASFWNPALLAREAAGVDVLTGGRLELGIGAGYAEAEFVAAGLPYPPAGERVDRLAEMVPLVRRLLDGEEVTAARGHYPLRRCATGLPSSQRPVPVMVGGNGDRVLAVAAAHADIVGFVGFTSGIARQSRRLTHFTWEGLADRVGYVRQQAGRRAGELELSVLLQEVAVSGARRSAAQRMAAEFQQPAALLLDSPFVMIGSVAELAAHVHRLRDEHGVTYLTVFEAFAPAFAQVMDAVRGRSWA